MKKRNDFFLLQLQRITEIYIKIYLTLEGKWNKKNILVSKASDNEAGSLIVFLIQKSKNV